MKGLQRPFLHEDKLTWGRIVASADLQPVQLTTVTTSLHNSDQAVHPNHKMIVRSIRWGAAQQQRFGKMCIYNYQLFINVSQYSCQAVEDSYMRMSRYVCAGSNAIESELSSLSPAVVARAMDQHCLPGNWGTSRNPGEKSNSRALFQTYRAPGCRWGRTA